ncbi:MAG: CinA family protein [Pelagibaca sp.]
MTGSRAETLLALARAYGATVTTAESCTGGMMAAAITDVAGSSEIFERGFVTYSNAAKTDLLGVSPATLDAHGAVSEEVTREMALGALRASGATVAVSISGIAGPGGSEFKPEGRVCFGLATRESVQTKTVEFGAIGRAEVRAAARDEALDLLIAALRDRQV